MESKLKTGRLLGLGASALVTVLLWRLPGGNYLLYPFTILATWFHEMGHGLTALMMGGTFHDLHLFANGSGFAQTGGTLFLGRVGPALVAAGGPLGPALAGSLLILTSTRPQLARISLTVLASALLISGPIWIRTGFGWLAI
jgi:hypothetical protein